MIRSSYRTMGVVEPNLLSLSDFLNFKKHVIILLNHKKIVTKAKDHKVLDHKKIVTKVDVI